MKSGHRLGAALLGAVVALALGTDSPRAAELTFLQLTGGVQGPIHGDSQIPQQQNKIEAQEIHHLIRRDQGTGRMVHEPFIFTKTVDRSTVNLHRAMDTNETLTAVFRYYRPDPSGNGTTQQFYTVTLIDAVIVAIEPIKMDQFDAIGSTLPDRERVRMIYQRLRVEFPSDGGESYEFTAN